MGRPKGAEKYRNEVIIIEENKKWKCKHCNRLFNSGFSRIKYHLDKTRGKGISICSVYQNKEGPSSSIDPQQLMNTLNPSQDFELEKEKSILDEQGLRIAENQENSQKNRHKLAENTRGSAELGVSGGSNGYSDLSTSQSQLIELASDLKREEEDIMGQLHWFESCGKKRKREVDDWLDELKKLKKAIDMNNSLHQFGSSVVPMLEIPDSNDELLNPYELATELRDLLEQKPLVLSNEFIGKEFEDNVGKMWELLRDDKVLTIGIHGMGGAGKTCLATYMHNEIKRKATFNHVFWVTVSHDFTIFKLQHHIAQTIGFKLDVDYEDTRAIILASELEKLEKTVLILDDVWKYIDLQKVGIPLKANGIKLIITTRLKHVCQQMDCLPRNNMIQISPCFGGEEGWQLFLLKLGEHGTPATLPLEVQEIARSVVMKCDGLPLGINVVARTMKGRNHIVWWRHALLKFETLEIGQEVKEEVLTVLKRSFDHLIEKDLQKCVLYCALLPNKNHREDLVTKLIESGVLNGKRSLRETFEEGHIIVDKLIDHSLLVLQCEEDDVVEMHGLVRIMACHILNMMVKCNEGLIKIPHLQEWRVDLEAVSLAKNNIKEIRKGTSPNCPRLSILILSNNEISDIPECFFTHMNALTLLDLSYNRTLTSLPNSLSKLTSLISLVLRNCSQLVYIPPLGALHALSSLDISGCSINQVPEGLQNLINLKWLDLSQTENTTFITVPGSVLSGLTNMQYLDLRACTGIKVEDLQGMTMLECFGGSFLNWDDCYHCIQKIQDNGYGSETYLIHYGKLENWLDEDPIYSEFNLRSVRFGDCEALPYLLPKDLTKLFVLDNNQWVCLCSALFSTTGSSLKNIDIKNCTKLKSLFCLSSSCSLCPNIQNLESLRLDNLKSLTAICKEDDVDLPQSLSRSGVFSHLKHFEIWGCHKIEMLLTPALVPQLQNLERLSVGWCYSMKEIFAASSSGDDNSFNITLPKLTTLELDDLPELKSVCKGILICGFEDILKNIHDCPKLEVLPKIHRHH